jgi:hypothetical protein
MDRLNGFLPLIVVVSTCLIPACGQREKYPMKHEDLNEEHIRREWIHKAWDRERGIATSDLNNSIVLIRSSVEEVAQALAPSMRTWVPNVLGQEVLLAKGSIFVFRLRGQSWTEIVCRDYVEETFGMLGEEWEKELSRRPQTRLIYYVVSDSTGCVGYWLWQKGELLEKFFAVENGEGGPRRGESGFFSKQRATTIDDIKNMWVWADQFFREEDAFDSGIEFDYFLGHREARVGERVTVQNPGFGLVVGGETVWSKPEIDRVDYLSPGIPIRVR